MFKNSVSYKGSARVLLKNLELDRMRYIDQTKVTKLARRFEADGCYHDDLGESSLAVLIDFEKSQHSLAAAGFPKSTDYNEQNSLPLDLPETVKFTLLYGDHRVLAAQKHLPAKDRWWSVHVFDSGISIEDRARVMQKTRRASQAPNGRVLAAMLNVRDRALLDSWKLEKHQKTTFKRLRDADEKHLHGIIKTLLCYRGLQESAGGNWAPILEMHCFEEVYAYLSAVERTWKYILGPDIRPDQLDESTVVALQMQIPDSSTDDCDTICKLFDNNKVFPLVEDQYRRKRLSERVLNCKRILSFQSFFDDFRYIRPCFESLSILLPEGSWREEKSFQQVFKHNWNGNTQRDSREHDFLRCYIELWLFAMREFPSLSSGKTSLPLQDKASTNKLIRPRLTVSKKEVEFACNASLLGFDTCEIERFKRMHPSGIQQVGPNRLPPEYSCDDRPLPRKARSNRPSVDSYLEDRDYLHPIYMIHANPARKKRYATRIAVTKDIVQCCWTDIERWAASPRRSQKRRFPIPIRTISTDKVPQETEYFEGSSEFNTDPFLGPSHSNPYREFMVNPELDPVSTKMEFSKAFLKAQGMEERSSTLQTTKHGETRADHEFDPVTKALQSLETPNLGSGEANGTSFGAQNTPHEKKVYDDWMDTDLPNENSPSLEVEPLNVAIGQGLHGKDGKFGHRTFLSPQPDDTTEFTTWASSIYSLQDVTQVLSESAPHSFPQGEAPTSHSKFVEGVRKDPSISIAAESSSETIRAQSSSDYGREAGDRIDKATELLNDTSSVEDSTRDGPTDGQGSYSSFKSPGDVSRAHDSTSGGKGPLPSISRRTAIRGDDGLHEREDTHDATIRNAERYRSGDTSMKLNPDGKKATSAELTNGLDEVKSSLRNNSNRFTQVPLKRNGGMPLGTSNEDGAPSVKNGARKGVLGKRGRDEHEPEGYKDKRQRSTSPRSIGTDGSL